MAYLEGYLNRPWGLSAGVDVSGLLLHKDDVFVHVSHQEGYEGPMSVEDEGFLAGTPMVRSSTS